MPIAPLLALGLLGAAPEAFRPNVAPTPRWVEPVPVPSPTADSGPSALEHLLVDHQARIDAGHYEDFWRFAWHIGTTAGLEEGANLVIDLDPQREQLLLHEVTVHRAGERQERGAATTWHLTHEEPQGAEQIYDGAHTVRGFVPDVRVGDVVLYAFSIVGRDPLLGDHFATSFPLGYDTEVRSLSHRLRVRGPRPLHARIIGDGSGTLAGERHANGPDELLRWVRRDVPAYPFEDGMPSWHDAAPWVQLSDFASWQEVATWAAELYERAAAAPLGPELESTVDAWGRLPTPAARFAAARRFVQDDVRYLGMEIGPHTFAPERPAQVFAQRFGDCKDKALLLVTVLGRLGIDAVPVLVDIERRERLTELLPSPYVFDHVIVEVDLEGRPLFVDATVSHQRGDPEALASPDLGRGLRVDRQRGGELVSMPAAAQELDLEVQEIFDRGAPDPTLVTTLVHRGSHADDLRARLSREGLEPFAREHLDAYRSSYPKIRGLGAESRDDPVANVVVVELRYGGVSRAADRDELRAWLIESELVRPPAGPRHAPWAVTQPSRLRHHIRVVDGPELPAQDREPVVVDTAAFTLSRVFEDPSDGALAVELRYTSKTEHVGAAQLAAYGEEVDRALAVLNVSLPAASSTSLSESPVVLAATALCAGLIGFAWGRRRRSLSAAAPPPG